MGILYDDVVIMRPAEKEGDPTVITVNCPDKTGLGCDLCRIILFFGLNIVRGGNPFLSLDWIPFKSLIFILILHFSLNLKNEYLSLLNLRDGFVLIPVFDPLKLCSTENTSWCPTLTRYWHMWLHWIPSFLKIILVSIRQCCCVWCQCLIAF